MKRARENKKSPAISHWAIKTLEREESLDLTHQPWKGCALPLKLFPHCIKLIDSIVIYICL